MPTLLRLLPRSTTTTTTITGPLLGPLRTSPSTTAAHHHHHHLITPTTRPYSSSSFRQPSPSPPRLPAEQQAEFERLQRAVADRLADPMPLPHERQPSSSSSSPPPTTAGRPETPPVAAQAGKAPGPHGGDADADGVLPATGGVWRGARPEFDGDTNPRTGEVGGPKTEPLRWGSGGDWSYNGRVTDF